MIDRVIKTYSTKGEKLETIRRYITKNYNITIDKEALRRRLKQLDLTTS